LPSGLDRLQHWWQTMANHDSIQAIAKPKTFYTEKYAQLAPLFQ
jgi:hypothetical protein